MSYDGPPIKQVTNEWIECFSKPENQNCVMARLSLHMLPVGVDEDDERVKEILLQIKKRNSGKGA